MSVALFVAWCSDFCFFFFKQKTAYEMRISDWSSDVCSSDLLGQGGALVANLQTLDHRLVDGVHRGDQLVDVLFHFLAQVGRNAAGIDLGHGALDLDLLALQVAERRLAFALGRGRSEEHTSELQSLMRISYAVFCLKKKHIIQTTPTHTAHVQQT